ncbi:hypothetical protein [Paenibacillus solani]|uniref:hypothetical protein n=1 Tax=Paenibacillus solani TaxID=1705565 RepID=UPI003D276824
MKRWNLSQVAGLVFGILLVVTIILQIVNTSETSTKLEQTLFSVLQFIFSIIFGWLVTRISTKNEFEQSQKRFALSAYRRIKEIEKAVNMLIDRTHNKMSAGSEDVRRELESIETNSIFIRETIKSSIADWADIIGEEIDNFNKIEQKEEELNKLQEQQNYLDNNSEKVDQLNNELKGLIETLPNQLKIVRRIESSFQENLEDNKNIIEAMLSRKGFIEVSGLIDGAFDFEFANEELQVNKEYEVSLGDVKGRIAILVVKNNQGKAIGMITNSFKHDYSIFMEALTSYLQSSNFRIKVIRKKINSDSTRVDFKAKILDKSEK